MDRYNDAQLAQELKRLVRQLENEQLYYGGSFKKNSADGFQNYRASDHDYSDSKITSSRKPKRPVSSSVAFIICGAVAALAYCYYHLVGRRRRRSSENRSSCIKATTPTREQQREARQKRQEHLLAKLESSQRRQQQQQQQEKQQQQQHERSRQSGKLDENSSLKSNLAEEESSSKPSPVGSSVISEDDDGKSTTSTLRRRSRNHDSSNASASAPTSSTERERRQPQYRPVPTPLSGTTPAAAADEELKASTTEAPSKKISEPAASDEISAGSGGAAAATAVTVNNSRKKEGAKKKKPDFPKQQPLDILCHSLSSITGLTIVGSRDQKRTAATTHANKNNATIVLEGISGASAAASWEELYQSSILWIQIQSAIQPYWMPSKNKRVQVPSPSYYAPVKLSDGPVWKAATWYKVSKDFAKNSYSSRVVSKDTSVPNLQLCLDQFAQQLVAGVARELHNEIVSQGLDRNGRDDHEENNDDSEDVEMGLFEETYGSSSNASSSLGCLNQSYLNESNSDNHDTMKIDGIGKNKNGALVFLDELLKLLGDPSCMGVLTRAFLGDLINTYEKTTTRQRADDDNSAPSSSSSLSWILLDRCLELLPSPADKSAIKEWNVVQRDISAVSNLLTLSPGVVQTLVDHMGINTSNNIKNGKDWEDGAVLRSLVCLSAWTVPRFDPDYKPPAITAGAQGGAAGSANSLVPFAFDATMKRALEEHYPVIVFAKTPDRSILTSYQSITKGIQIFMKQARMASSLGLRKLAATTSSNSRTMGKSRGALFPWLTRIVHVNEPLVDLLQADLLDPESEARHCSTRPFLLGLAASLLQLCCQNLSERLQKQKQNAFDPKYFRCDDTDRDDKVKVGICISRRERRLLDTRTGTGLVDQTENSNKKKEQTRFAGATEFFFLTASMLRVSLFPGIRVYEEFSTRYKDAFAGIRALADKNLSKDDLGKLPTQVTRVYQSLTSVMLGWMVATDDPEFSTLVTSFSLLQLEWLVLLLQSPINTSAQQTSINQTERDLSLIPEWFCKLPAQWLAHVAMYTPQLLKPHQGEAAVAFATQLLEAGTSKITLSPPVLTELIRVASAFVRAGVNRAIAREKTQRRKTSKHNRRGFPFQKSTPTETDEDEDFELDLIDSRELDIYHSFDHADLGVTVFTNDLVATQLCPTLIRSYYALDAVEGMDVEREHHFDKFLVKDEVADLLLRLWSHPTGKCRLSIVEQVDTESMSQFGASVASALGLLLHNAFQNIIDIRDIHWAHRRRYRRSLLQLPLSSMDGMICEQHATQASAGFKGTRQLLMLLCQLSTDSGIAATFGGFDEQGADKMKRSTRSSFADLAAMFVNLMDRLTDEDGGINAELDVRLQADAPAERSAKLLRRLGSLSPDELSKALHDLIYARRFVLLEYGVSANLLAHQLLALAARWHLAAVYVGKDGGRSSKFLAAVATNEVCNVRQLRNAFARLVGSARELYGSESQNAAYILERDGHVDISIWKAMYKIPGTGPDESRHRRLTNRQDRMTHKDIDRVASRRDIQVFLDDLENAAARTETTFVAAKWGEDTMDNLEGKLLSQGSRVSEDEYNDVLADWVVSSESFLSSSGNGCFAHFYDSHARSRSLEAIGLGKILVKEARKCKRIIPSPHPNASIFVCFAEERMDLCRTIVTGTADTPFSLGLFEFDVFFPATFPSSPPLLTFKTTGKGQTRASPNLYNDGKVCISILGTAHANHDSQRWNASQSSLAQVLTSIQTQILGVPDPYFSDGFGHEGVRGTAAGEKGSARFNNEIRLYTMRRAMIAHLRKPPQGFEDVVKKHFSLCRRRILVQTRRWTMEAQGTNLFHRFTKSYEELVTLLSSNDLLQLRKPTAAIASDNPTTSDISGAISPDESEIEALAALDPLFVQKHKHLLNSKQLLPAQGPISPSSLPHSYQGDAEMEPITGAALPLPVDNYNPWANGNALQDRLAAADVDRQRADNVGDDDDDDDFYA